MTNRDGVPTTVGVAPTAHWPGPSASAVRRPVVVESDRIVLDVVVPVFNEERDLARSVQRLDDYLATALPHRYRITIADNGSTDATPQKAVRLAAERPSVRLVRIDAKGRGRALRTVWETSDAPVLAYMDVDLSTNLTALPPLVAPLISGHCDLAIGSRLARGSHVVRGAKREFISRGYNLLVRTLLRTHFSDAQCGFKAIRADSVGWLLPIVRDNTWFFDTELLVLAERSGLRIQEIPVDWVEDPDSRVNILRTAFGDLRGLWRIATGLATGRLRREIVAGRAHQAPGTDPPVQGCCGASTGLDGATRRCRP